MRVCSSTALASYTSFGFGCLLFDAMLPLLTLCCRFSLDLFAKRACRRNCFLQHAQTVEKTLVLERAAFLASRLLNHSRFPDGRAHGFAALANIGVLRAGRAQPLYLLTPAGRFALRATAHRADASLRCAPGRFATSGGKCPQGTRFPSRLRTLATLTKNAAA